MKNTVTMVLKGLIILFPLFFLPVTQEFYTTNKLYFLSFGLIVVGILLVAQLFLGKKIALKRTVLDVSLLIFLVTNAITVVFSSPNKVEAILNPVTGLLPLVALIALYFLLTQLFKEANYLNLLSTPVLILSALNVLFFVNPLAKLARFNPPPFLQFLKTSSFNLLGDQLSLVLFLGFFVVAFVITLITSPLKINEKGDKFRLASFLVILVAFFLNFYQVIKAQTIRTPPVSSSYLTPFSYTWYATVETLKQPKDALFGVGPDNFSSLYNRVKPITYNQTPLWNANLLNEPRSYVLGLWAETGLLGLLGFGLVIFFALKQLLSFREKNRPNYLFYMLGYLLLVMFFFPPSLLILFLFFLVLATIAHEKEETGPSYHLHNVPFVYGGMSVLSVIVIGAIIYLLGRSYGAELYYKQSLDGLAKNNAKIVYDNMRQAVIFNPFIERYRMNFSQINLLIANNVASKPQDKLTNQDRQNITQAIQASIAEAKAAVALNSQKASNWENLAVIYRNIINIAQGAEIWAISSYQRAILLDPQNPLYRLNLGGVYYSLGKYDDALKFFEQAVVLKPDWANAHYNLAWTSYQKADYVRAASELQTAISLIDPQKDRADFEKAQSQLETFKAKLPKETSTATESAQPTQLTLPTPAKPVEPKIKLPSEASPEAK